MFIAVVFLAFYSNDIKWALLNAHPHSNQARAVQTASKSSTNSKQNHTTRL
jgi:hypothetical protein